MMTSRQSDDCYDAEETKRRAEAAIVRALNTLHKPHKPLKASKSKFGRKRNRTPHPKHKA